MQALIAQQPAKIGEDGVAQAVRRAGRQADREEDPDRVHHHHPAERGRRRQGRPVQVQLLTHPHRPPRPAYPSRSRHGWGPRTSTTVCAGSHCAGTPASRCQGDPAARPSRRRGACGLTSCAAASRRPRRSRRRSAPGPRRRAAEHRREPALPGRGELGDGQLGLRRPRRRGGSAAAIAPAPIEVLRGHPQLPSGQRSPAGTSPIGPPQPAPAPRRPPRTRCAGSRRTPRAGGRRRPRAERGPVGRRQRQPGAGGQPEQRRRAQRRPGARRGGRPVARRAATASRAAAARSPQACGNTPAPRPTAMSTDVLNDSTSTMITAAQSAASSSTPGRPHSSRTRWSELAVLGSGRGHRRDATVRPWAPMRGSPAERRAPPRWRGDGAGGAGPGRAADAGDRAGRPALGRGGGRRRAQRAHRGGLPGPGRPVGAGAGGAGAARRRGHAAAPVRRSRAS